MFVNFVRRSYKKYICFTRVQLTENDTVYSTYWNSSWKCFFWQQKMVYGEFLMWNTLIILLCQMLPFIKLLNSLRMLSFPAFTLYIMSFAELTSQMHMFVIVGCCSSILSTTQCAELLCGSFIFYFRSVSEFLSYRRVYPHQAVSSWLWNDAHHEGH